MDQSLTIVLIQFHLNHCSFPQCIFSRQINRFLKSERKTKPPTKINRFSREIKVVNSQTMQNLVDFTNFSLKFLIRITKCLCNVLLKVRCTNRIRSKRTHQGFQLNESFSLVKCVFLEPMQFLNAKEQKKHSCSSWP